MEFFVRSSQNYLVLSTYPDLCADYLQLSDKNNPKFCIRKCLENIQNKRIDFFSFFSGNLIKPELNFVYF